MLRFRFPALGALLGLFALVLAETLRQSDVPEAVKADILAMVETTAGAKQRRGNS